MTFNCDAAAGYRSEWTHPLGTHGSARGAVFLALLRRDPTSPGMATIGVSGATGRAWMVITVDQRNRTLMPMVRYADAGAKPVTTLPFRPRPISGTTFELAWQPKLLRLRLETTGPWLDVPLSFTPEQFVLGCASSNAVFHSLAVEPQRPTTTDAKPIAP